MQEHDRFAGGIAALLVMDAMQWRNLQETRFERFDLGIQHAAIGHANDPLDRKRKCRTKERFR
jgi:hypothetical protein